jgi:hypothetical protein
MFTRLTVFCIFSLVSGTIVDGNAASTLKMTCSGNLTNTRADGVTLGQCDLNFLSVKAMTEIENVCGIPVDTPAENQCRIRAVVAPDASSARGAAPCATPVPLILKRSKGTERVAKFRGPSVCGSRWCHTSSRRAKTTRCCKA